MKNNNINMSLYISLSNFFYSFLILNNFSFDINENLAFLIPIILCILSFILFMFLPKCSFIKVDNKFIKTILILYLVLSSVLLVYFSSHVLSYFFYNNMSFILIIFLLLLLSLLISMFKLKYILDISTTFFIIILLFNLVVLLNTSTPSINLLYNINISEIAKTDTLFAFSMLFILLDPLTLYLTNLTNNTNLNKCITLSTIISMLTSSLCIFINYLYYSKEYLSLNIYPFYTALTSFLGPEFIDHFTILILINTVTFTLLKISYNISFSSILIKESSLNNILFAIIIFLISYLLLNINISNSVLYIILCFILTITLIIIYLYIIRKGGKKSAITKDEIIN